MSINVYWSSLENEWLRAKTPESVLKKHIKENKDSKTFLNNCPAYIDYFNNVFSIKSIYSYSFSINEDKTVSSEIYDQKFFDKHVLIRSIDEKYFSFIQNIVFFTDEKSLEMSFEPPILEDNNISKSCIVIPGKFDIGKWYRNIEFAFKLKDGQNSFTIKEGEVYGYVRFHTKEKINFVQFKSDGINEYIKDSLNSRNYHTFKNLQYYYNIFKNKNNIVRDIKNNLV